MANSTTELLDILALHVGDNPRRTVSDRYLALNYFNVTPQKISEYRTEKRCMMDERVIDICEEMWPGDDAQKAKWLLRIHADREQNVHVKAVWERLAKQVAAIVIALSMGAGGLGFTPVEAAQKLITSDDSIYIMRNSRRGKKQRQRRGPAKTTTKKRRRVAAAA